MTNYYNKKNGPISLTLLDGKTYFFPSKKRTPIRPELESSPALLRSLKKGHLHKEINLSFSEETVIKEATENKSEILEGKFIEENVEKESEISNLFAQVVEPKRKRKIIKE